MKRTVTAQLAILATSATCPAQDGQTMMTPSTPNGHVGRLAWIVMGSTLILLRTGSIRRQGKPLMLASYLALVV